MKPRLKNYFDWEQKEIFHLSMNSSHFFDYYWRSRNPMGLTKISEINIQDNSCQWRVKFLSVNMEYTPHDTVIALDSCNSGHSENYDNKLKTNWMKFPTKWHYKTLYFGS